MEQAVFVSRAGHESQQTETDLRNLRGKSQEAGYLSIILIHTRRGKTP
jgi:precorrin-2 methylase